MSIRPTLPHVGSYPKLQVHTHRNLPSPISFRGEDSPPPKTETKPPAKKSVLNKALVATMAFLTGAAGIGLAQKPMGPQIIQGVPGLNDAQILDMSGTLYKKFTTGGEAHFAFRDNATQKSYILAADNNDEKMQATLQQFNEGDTVSVKTRLGGGLNMTQWGPYTTVQSIGKSVRAEEELNLKGTIYKRFDDGGFAIRNEKTNESYIIKADDNNATLKKEMTNFREGSRVRAKAFLGEGLNMTQWGPVTRLEKIESASKKQTIEINRGSLFKVPDVAFNQLESFIIRDGKENKLYRIAKENDRDTHQMYRKLLQDNAQFLKLSGTIVESDVPGAPSTILVKDFTIVWPED